jgi:hypothetical protein
MDGTFLEPTAGASEIALATAMETQARLLRLYPRDEKAATRELLKLCRDPRWAADVTYTLDDRDDEDERDRPSLLPSVQFTRAVSDAWRGILTGSRIVRVEHEAETIEAYVFDAKSLRVEQLQGPLWKTVKRRNPDGSYRIVWRNEQELLAARHKLAALLVRRCLQNVLPTKLVDRLLVECERTLERDAARRLAADSGRAVLELVMDWSTVGVERAQLEALVGHGLDTLNAAEHVRLAGLRRGIEDGSISLEQALGQRFEEELQRPAPAATPVQFVPPPNPLKDAKWPPDVRPKGSISDADWNAVRPKPAEPEPAASAPADAPSIPAEDLPF